ncbi:hypothetical protein BH11GEM1_BH11GEM1_31400 [soil metagenome]
MSKSHARRTDDGTSASPQLNSGVVTPTDLDKPEAPTEAIAPADAVAQRAYERFVARGFEHGQDLEDWCAAEQELLAE